MGPPYWAPRPPVPLPSDPRGHPSLLVLFFAAMIFFCATRGPSSALSAPSRSPAARLLCAARPPLALWGVVRVFCFLSPCFFPRGSLLPACTHNNTASPSVSVPFGAHVQSHRHPVARPLAVPGHARWAPLPRVPVIYAFDEVNLLCLLSTLPSPLSPARPLSVVLLLRVLAAGRPRAMVVSRALSRASGPLPCLPTCRPTWAASPDTPFGGTPPSSSPAGRRSISSLMVGRGGRYGSMPVIGMAFL